MKVKCNYKIAISNNKSRCCKANVYLKYLNFMNKNYCYMHFQKTYNSFIIKIQKIFRGFKIRKKLNNIYKKLPEDIQNLIISYIRRDINKQYLLAVNRVINKKILFIDDLFTSLLPNYIYNENINNIIINKLINIYNLFNKNYTYFDLSLYYLYFIKLYIFAKYFIWVYSENNIIYLKVDLISIRNYLLRNLFLNQQIKLYIKTFENNFYYQYSPARINTLLSIY